MASSALARVISTEHKSVLLGQVDTFRAIANLGQGQVAHAHSNAVNQAPCTTCGPAKGQQASAEVHRATSASTYRPAPVASKVAPARSAKGREAETERGRRALYNVRASQVPTGFSRGAPSNLGPNLPTGARRQQSGARALGEGPRGGDAGPTTRQSPHMGQLSGIPSTAVFSAINLCRSRRFSLSLSALSSAFRF